MKTLYLLRHAKSSPYSPTGGDHDRPLNDRGRRDAPRMGRVLRKVDGSPEHVLCSTSARTRETADLFLERCKYKGEVDYLDEIYEAEPEALHRAVARQGDADRLLMIGHNPGTELFLCRVIGGPEAILRVPTCALTRIDFDIDEWADIDRVNGMLVWHLIPAVINEL
ncbi:2,3-bisphosphoglycerate-dependent phosphoglycerate mutase [Planctomycetes bacterium Pan216]|uniref:2,3-bisphosphoglycerate-dependent phosphoglycerate mutase n=1 Tax=Kolteria novifilia TaxID=2527975 RepID=A0A518BCQ1_9BACT|nr:2,3-bisphosphoglycerate-dependent phosphoglycerate mutase [Planctomycetes bacterium Pan216]